MNTRRLLAPVMAGLTLIAAGTLGSGWLPELAAQDSRPRSSSKTDAAKFPGAPQLLPDDTLAYIRIADAQNIRQEWGGTSMGKMLDDPELKPFVADFYQTGAELFESIGSELGITLDELLAIPHGQIAAGLLPARFSDEQLAQLEQDDDDESDEAIRRRIRQKRRRQNGFAGLFILDAGDNLDRLMDLVGRGIETAESSGYVARHTKVDGVELKRWLPPRPGRPPIEMFEQEGTLVVGIGNQTASLALDHLLDRSDEKTLAERPDFVSLISRCVGEAETRPQATFFVDPYRIVERLVKRGGAAGFIWPIIEELGLPRLRGIAGSSFRGGEFFEDITHLHIGIDPPRDGFFGVLRPAEGKTAPPSWVPADCVSYTTVKWRFDVAYENLGKIVMKFMGGQPFSETVEKPFKNATGLSLPDDVIANLTGRFVFSRMQTQPVRVNSIVNIQAFEIKDAAKFKTMVAELRDKNESWLSPETRSGQLIYRFGPQGQGGPGPNFPAAFRRPEPSLVVIDRWAIVTDSLDVVDTLIRTARDGNNRLFDDIDYQITTGELSGMLDGETPFMISYVRGEEFLRQGYELLKSDQTRAFLKRDENNPVLSSLAELLDRHQLPEFDKLRKYFAPAGAYMYDEPGGVHWASYTLRADD
ncbi:MAG: DUF3352 domain-containing protein [Planctomycetota bacterium]